MTALAIWTRNLSKRFGDRLSVDGLCLSVPAGSVYALLGPNGAGKTTTVRMLAGLMAPSSGDVHVAGLHVQQDEATLSALHHRVGLLTESPGMWERLSAGFNLDVYAELYGVANSRAVVERYLRLVGLWERRADPVARLSMGMRQRLAIARAILHEPPVLFLDEPTSGLDPEAAASVRDLIFELRAEGRAILLCTHNLEEAEKLSDRIGIFNRSLLLEGSVDGLRRSVFPPEVHVRLRLPDRPERHLRCAGVVPGVREVRVEGDMLVLQVHVPDDMLPRLTRALVENGAQILSVGERTRSLEEVYFRVLARNNL